MDLFKILDGTPEPPIVQLHTKQNTSGDYWLPVPMSDYQKELTDQVISLHYSDILKYFETDDKDQLLLDSLETLYLNSQLVATHPFLLIKQYFPKNLTAKDVPIHLAHTSGKFQVLKDVVTLLEDTSRDVAIVARSGQTLDLIESLLLGCKTNIKRFAGNHIKDPLKNTKQINKTLNTYIISSDPKENKFKKVKRFDLVFSFDITTETEFLENLKSLPTSPILRFVTSNSIDHVALYFRKSHKERSRDYLVDVTAATVVLRDRVGVLPPDLRPIYAKNLSYLKDWFHNYLKPWPLPELSKIKKYDSLDVERSLLTEVVFEKKDLDETKKSLYEIKRLNKEYTSNPLKTFNTGILQTNSNYNDTLTHKLIQELNLSVNDLNLQKQFFNNLKQFDENKNNFTTDDNTKLNIEINEINEKLSNFDNRNKDLLNDIEINKNKIIELKKSNENDEIKLIKQEIKNELNKFENQSTEKQYMIKEIENANNSINDSNNEILKIKNSIGENELNLNNYFQNFNDNSISTDNINNLQDELKDLKLKIEANLNQLNSSRSRH